MTRIFGFREFRKFDVTGEYSGLNTKVMMAPDGKIRIPINEEGEEGGKARSREYLRTYNGEGIQHIALAEGGSSTPAWTACKQKGLSSPPPPPDTYYEMLDGVAAGHGELLEQAARARHPRGRDDWDGGKPKPADADLQPS